MAECYQLICDLKVEGKDVIAYAVRDNYISSAASQPAMTVINALIAALYKATGNWDCWLVNGFANQFKLRASRDKLTRHLRSLDPVVNKNLIVSHCQDWIDRHWQESQPKTETTEQPELLPVDTSKRRSQQHHGSGID